MSDREFFDKVAALGYQWKRGPDGLRTVAGRCPGGMCPLTALAWFQTGERLMTWEVRRALSVVGVSAQFAFEIARAADNSPVTFTDYRARLFSAAGVS